MWMWISSASIGVFFLMVSVLMAIEASWQVRKQVRRQCSSHDITRFQFGGEQLVYSIPIDGSIGLSPIGGS